MTEQKTALERLALAARRPTLGETKATAPSARKAAFDVYMRKGDASRLLETKDLSAGSDAEGGYVVPEETQATIDRLLTVTSPIRSIATVRETGYLTFKKPVSLGGAAAGWAGETGERAETNSPTLALLDFPTAELYSMPAATQTLLDDVYVNVDEWLASEVMDVFAEAEGAAFVSGDGDAKPKGFLAYTKKAEGAAVWGELGYVASGAAGAFPAYARAGEDRFRPVIDLAAPVPLDAASAERLAQAWLADAAAEAETLALTLGPEAFALEAGDVVLCSFLDGPASGPAYRPAYWPAYRIERIEGGFERRLSLRRVSDAPGVETAGPEPGVIGVIEPPPAPFGVVIDAPVLGAQSARGGPLVAASADPWPGAVVVEAGPDAASLVEVARLTRPAYVGELLWDLWPGPLWRWDEGGRVRIRLPGAALSSATDAAVLSGANVLAVQGGSGAWEILQFRSATLTAPDEWELSGFLRGQAGSETPAVAPAGSRVVLLDGSAEAAPLDEAWRDAPLVWRFSALRGALGETVDGVYAGVDQRPLSPAHLRGVRTPEGVELGWIRRTRVGGDDWAAVETPLGEAVERYRVEVLDGDAVVWSIETDVARALFPADVEASVFADAPRTSLSVRVAQFSHSVGWGAPRADIVYL